MTVDNKVSRFNELLFDYEKQVNDYPFCVKYIRKVFSNSEVIYKITIFSNCGFFSLSDIEFFDLVSENMSFFGKFMICNDSLDGVSQLAARFDLVDD